jgi:hypothetical protein
MIARRNRSIFAVAAVVSGLFVIEAETAALASPLGMTRSAIEAPDSAIEEIALRGGFARRGGVARRGNINVNRNINVSRNFNRNINRNVNVTRTVSSTVVRTAGWVRPAGYRWRPGGAMAAGAAVGFVTAATAVAWAGMAPGPNLCWYYTDSSRREGFWDTCP